MTSRVSLAQALNYAQAAYEQRAYVEAEGICLQVLAVIEDNFDALHLLAVIHAAQGRSEAALAGYERSLALSPDHAQALSNRSVVLHRLGRYDEALASCDRALQSQPDYRDALNNRGAALEALRRPIEALQSYDRALALHPDHADAQNNRGNVLQTLRRYGEAVQCYDRALAVRGNFPQALCSRGDALRALNRFDEALDSYARAIALQPDHADSHYNRALTLQSLKRFDEALQDFDAALSARLDHPYALNGVAECVMRLCDWGRRDETAACLAEDVEHAASVVFPFPLANYSSDPVLLRRAAEHFVADGTPLVPPATTHDPARRTDRRLRIAYVSGDFRNHPMSHLIAELFELHDRKRVEVLVVSFGPDDKSPARARIAAAADAFHDVQDRSAEEIAALLTDLQVDVAVDLMGYTQDARPAIFCTRPAPVQISYLGFATTTGAPWMDYVIADPVVLPFEDQAFFTEQIVHLPDTYWVNDRRLRIAERAPGRTDAGLPPNGFVFCCFNNAAKITPAVFDIWMRLLAQVPGSVLWLFSESQTAEANLRKEAQTRGIDPGRLVFAAPAARDEHLARHRLADLFLDTLPYCAHTTASDALWAGLPLLTCKGTTFAGRVAASLLSAAGLPELITTNPADYEATALRLARDPAALAELRRRLEDGRDSCALFDTPRFARHMESAYETRSARWRSGQAPQAFAVEANMEGGPSVYNSEQPLEPGVATRPGEDEKTLAGSRKGPWPKWLASRTGAEINGD